MLAKRFFFICAGVFLLVLSYQWGVTSATAQSGGTPAAGAFNNTFSGTILTFVIDRTFFTCVDDGAAFQPTQIDEPVPGSSPIVATGSAGGASEVYLANGDVYTRGNGPGLPWSFWGNVPGGATPAKLTSLGQLKARFRDPAPTGR